MSGSGPPKEPTVSPSVNFFSLPIEIRNTIYERLLPAPTPLRIFQDPGCSLEVFLPERPYAWTALVYTNRQMSGEARAVLYRVNRFILQDTSFARRYRGSIVQSFLNSIGPTNAGFLSHLCISFPETEKLEGSDEIKLLGYTLEDFHRLQTECIELRTLEAFMYDEETCNLLEEDQISTANVQNAFREIAEQIKGIRSLSKIIVRIYSGSINPLAREFLQSLGWTVLIGDQKLG